ncbi:chemotaxis protein CheW [Algicola sagamiensis]|uniref:chemotaxis protein CheW n=1 Tax=Algicola sagamiensis TaxID=163869 RepID=UPI000378FC6C|nr:chemotaxis protein CheW [Algicola sagamiensis]
MTDIATTEEDIKEQSVEYDHEEHELEATGESRQFLTFMMDDEEYGVDILSVQEIRGWEPATVLPNAPDYVKGVINLRGTIVPVVDLRQRFGLDSMEYGAITVVVVVKVSLENNDEKIIGLVVDAISDVYTVKAENMRPAPDITEHANAEFIENLMNVEKNMVVLLNLPRLMEFSQSSAVQATS